MDLASKDKESTKNERVDLEAQLMPQTGGDLFTCEICFCEYDLKEDPTQVKMLAKCGHTFCSECFRDYYKSLIED